MTGTIYTLAVQAMITENQRVAAEHRSGSVTTARRTRRLSIPAPRLGRRARVTPRIA